MSELTFGSRSTYGLSAQQHSNSMKLTGALLGALLSLPCVAQTAHQGTIYFFRRHYAALTKPSVYVDGVRVARMQSASFFSIQR